MLILVSMRIADNSTYPERRDALSHDWGHLFDRYGLTPILIPNSLSNPGKYLELGAVGLLLTGGDSMGSEDQPTERDQTEIELICGSIEAGVPILGVCRGLQVLNRYFGGQVIQLANQDHVGTHTVRLQNASCMKVNSYHCDAVTQEGLATPLQPFAWAEHGIVEAFRHESLPITAIQWHPERTSPSATYDEEIIKDWIKPCAL